MTRSRIAHCCLFLCIFCCLAEADSHIDQLDVCTDEDYKVFASGLNGLFGTRNLGSMVLIDHTTTGYPPGLAAVTQVQREAKGLLGQVPKDAKEDFDIRNKNRAKVERSKLKLSFEIVTVSNEDASKLLTARSGWGGIRQKYPGTRGFVVISRPGFNRERNRAVLYIGFSCGSTCGGGTLLLLVKEAGEWKIVQKTTNWLS